MPPFPPSLSFLFSSRFFTFNISRGSAGAGYYYSTREFDITISVDHPSRREKLTVHPPFTFPSSVTFVTSRLHYANVGIEDEKLGYITSCVWFIIVNYEKPSCFLIQKYGEREREGGEFHLSKGKGMERCQPSLRRIGLKPFFYIVFPIHYRPRFEDAERKRDPLKVSKSLGREKHGI